MDKFERHVLNMPILEMHDIFESISRYKNKLGSGIANGVIFDTKLNPAWNIEQLDHRVPRGQLIILRVR